MTEHVWFEQFFQGPWLDVQRGLYDTEESEGQAALIERYLGLSGPSRLLDVPCGEGRISRALARRGHFLTGVDFNEVLLDDARSRAAEEGLDIDFHHADMRELNWAPMFDAAFCWWGSFGYFDEEGDARMLTAVARALVPGGRLLIDTHTTESLLPKFQPRDFQHIGDLLVLQDRHIDLDTARIEVEWTFIQDGREVVQHSSIRLYTYRELCALLSSNGFGSFRAFHYGTDERFSVRPGGGRLVLVATRV